MHPTRPRATAAIFAMAALVAAAPAATPAPVAAQQEPALVLVNVNVVPMDRERVIPGQTVVIQGDRITAIVDAPLYDPPADATMVDGRGGYLMPGLVDMHIHAVEGTGETGDGAWQQMALLVANGVTTARSLAGAPTAPALREAIRAGRLVGPELYLAGPSLNRRSVTTPEAARAAVAEQATAGFDFLKTHGVTGDVYEAIVGAAEEHDIRLVGHVTPDYGLERALGAGQQVEHLDGYLAAAIPAGSGVQPPAGQFFFGPELDHVDPAALDDLARRTVEAGVWNSPTLALFEIVAAPREAAHYLAWPETELVPDRAREAWAGDVTELAEAPVPAHRRQQYIELRRAMTRALRDAGAELLAGSDSPQLFLAPGFAMHRELEALQRAGLTPFQALAAGTSNPARYIGEGATFGVVAEGREADLLLLESNPLEDVGNARGIRGVVLDGRWLPDDQLEQLKSEVARAARGGTE